MDAATAGVDPAAHLFSHVRPVLGSREPGRVAAAQQVGLLPGSTMATSPGLSVNCTTVDYSVAPTKKTGISIVVDIENSQSPTVVTRQFSGIPTATIVHLEGTTKKNPLVNEVVAFGG